MVDSAGKRRLLFGCHHAKSASTGKEIQFAHLEDMITRDMYTLSLVALDRTMNPGFEME